MQARPRRLKQLACDHGKYGVLPVVSVHPGDRWHDWVIGEMCANCETVIYFEEGRAIELYRYLRGGHQHGRG